MRTTLILMVAVMVGGCAKSAPVQTYSFTTVANHTLRGIKDPNSYNITKKECLAYAYLIENLEDRVVALEKKTAAPKGNGG